MLRGNCADLPEFVLAKYFDCDGSADRFAAKTAKVICARCVVLGECREYALNLPFTPKRGVIGGQSAAQIRAARAWRRYEQGDTDVLPRVERPAWLDMNDASHDVERMRLAEDADEPQPEV